MADSEDAHQNLGKALTADQAMKRLNNKGHWAAERKGKIRVIEFHEQEAGDSHSVTFWFETWKKALEHYGMATHQNTMCRTCPSKAEEGRVYNPLGQWLCKKCYAGLNETQHDHFVYSLGHWDFK